MSFLQVVLSTALIVGMAITLVSGTNCVSGDIDAIVMGGDGRVYAFAGEYVSKLTSDGYSIENEYPKGISDEFPGLPDHIDLAVRWPNGKTYFFKGAEYWRFSGKTMDSGYPINITTGWPGMPDSDMDAAVLWPNGKAYFFRGSRYWRYDVRRDRMDNGYPLPIKGNWPGYTDDVDAAFLWNNGAAYLFKGEQYWRYNPKRNKVEEAYTYPKATTKLWFGCPTNDANIDMAGDNLFN